MFDSDGPMDCDLLGRVIGTASGWDEYNDWGIVFYDFVPNEIMKSSLPSTDHLYIDFEAGYVSYSLKNDKGDDISITIDIVELLKDKNLEFFGKTNRYGIT